MVVLVLNAGSSSLKFGLFGDKNGEELDAGVIELPDRGDYASAVRQLLRRFPVSHIRRVGHRIVHGGERFRAPTRLTAAVKTELHKLNEIAPLHNPPALATLAAAEKAFPRLPHFAVFDTAFYARLPPERVIYPLPYEWFSRWRLRRYGFHGISHAYAAHRAAEILRRKPSELNLVSCHLGNGCSATAIRAGVAVATTMGFTPLEGLMMGTRSGSVDPGLLFYVQRRHGLSAAAMEHQLNHASGVWGITGTSGDFRKLEQDAARGRPRAKLALAMFADRVRQTIGALATTMNRLDAVVFTAGIGEHSAILRSEAVRGLEKLGIRLDRRRNRAGAPDSDIGAAGASVRTLIVHAREEWFIARIIRSISLNS